MWLCEEYYKRHSKKVPLVKIQNLNFLYTKTVTNNRANWHIYSIVYDDTHSNTYSNMGTYIINKYTPALNDAKLNITNYESVEKQKVLLPIECADYFHDLATKIDKSSLILGRKEVMLCSWEMFVYSNNEFIAAKFQPYFESLFQSLDFTLGLDVRYLNFCSFLKLVGEKNDPFSTWKKETERHINNYCNWFADLIHG